MVLFYTFELPIDAMISHSVPNWENWLWRWMERGLRARMNCLRVSKYYSYPILTSISGSPISISVLFHSSSIHIQMGGERITRKAKERSEIAKQVQFGASPWVYWVSTSRWMQKRKKMISVFLAIRDLPAQARTNVNFEEKLFQWRWLFNWWLSPISSSQWWPSESEGSTGRRRS